MKTNGVLAVLGEALVCAAVRALRGAAFLEGSPNSTVAETRGDML